MKDKIICIIGESGSGKSVIVDLLAERLNWNKIKSYTTRIKRFEDEDTHTFIEDFKAEYTLTEVDEEFVSITNLNNGCLHTGEEYQRNEMIAHEVLNRQHYFITHSQYKNKGTSVCITSPQGAEQAKANAECEVVTVYLQADYRERLAKLDKREKRGDIPTLSFMDRIKKDKDIFHTINQVDHVIDANDDIETVYERVERCLYV